MTSTEDEFSSLTFGIELEFTLITEQAESPVLPTTVVADILRQPILDRCDRPGCQTTHRHFLTVDYNQYHFQSWTVGYDQSISLHRDEIRAVPDLLANFKCHNVEVRSPAFSYHDTLPTANISMGQEHDPWFTPSWEIRHALQLLQAVNDPEKHGGNLRIFSNSSCAFQVHVGSGIPSTGFPLQTIKRVLGLATVFERQLDSVHDITRIGGTPLPLYKIEKYSRDANHTQSNLDGTSVWCKPLSYFHGFRSYNSILLLKKGWDGTSEWRHPDIYRYPMSSYHNRPWLRSSGSTMSAIA